MMIDKVFGVGSHSACNCVCWVRACVWHDEYYIKYERHVRRIPKALSSSPFSKRQLRLIGGVELCDYWVVACAHDLGQGE